MQIETDAAVMLHKKSVCAQAITLLEQRRALEAHRGCGISVCIAQQYFLFPFLFLSAILLFSFAHSLFSGCCGDGRMSH